jgi:hypothetical protein
MEGRVIRVPLFFALSAFVADAASVRLTVLDPAGAGPVPARVHLQDSAGEPQRHPTLPFWRDHFVCTARVDIPLPEGNYTFQIERGPEFTAAAGAFSASEPTNVTVTLTRLTDLVREGWWSGELHVHRPPKQIPLLMQAEDLHIAHVITWWNNSNPWKDQPLPQNALEPLPNPPHGFFHVMAGEDERGGGALLYLNLAAPLDITGSKREFPSSIKYLRDARKHPAVHVDIEKPFWWDTPLWVSSGLVHTIGIAHNHMHRGGVLGNEAWGKPRDPAKYAGPQGNGRYTQDIYYHILNCGLRIPPSAGSASGVLPNPVGYNRVWVHCGDEFSWDKWHAGLRAGRTFVSNGPLLRCRANGQLPGHIFRTNTPLAVQFDIKLDSRDKIAALELVGDGKIHPMEMGDRAKTVTFQKSGWFLVRAIADLTNTFRFASTAPWYVEINNRPATVRGESAQFFLDWSRQRIEHLNSTNLTDLQREEVLGPWKEAEQFWRKKLAGASE